MRHGGDRLLLLSDAGTDTLGSALLRLLVLALRLADLGEDAGLGDRAERRGGLYVLLTQASSPLIIGLVFLGGAADIQTADAFPGAGRETLDQPKRDAGFSH